MSGAEPSLPSEGPAVVAFTAPWCHNCRRMAPSLAEAAAQHPGVKLVEVDVDASPEVASRYGVRSVPTLIGVHDGAERVRAVGDRPPATLDELFAGLESGVVPASLGADRSVTAARTGVGMILTVAGAVLGRPVLIILGVAFLAWGLSGLVPLARR